MQEVIVSLLIANGYEELSDNSDGEIRAFTSESFNDVIIIAEYSLADITDYETSPITVKVMDVFDSICESKPDSLKDTSLIMCLRIAKPEEQDTVKNAMLAAEENAYGFRKFVLVYSEDSIQAIKQIQAESLGDSIYEKLRSGFNEFADSASTDPSFSEYDVILQLFIKLPFMKLQTGDGNDDLPTINAFLKDKLGKHASTINFVREITEEYRQKSKELQTGVSVLSQDFDAQIEDLLTKTYMQQLKPENKEQGL